MFFLRDNLKENQYPTKLRETLLDAVLSESCPCAASVHINCPNITEFIRLWSDWMVRGVVDVAIKLHQQEEDKL